MASSYALANLMLLMECASPKEEHVIGPGEMDEIEAEKVFRDCIKIYDAIEYTNYRIENGEFFYCIHVYEFYRI